MRKHLLVLTAVLALSLGAFAADTYTIDGAHSSANFTVKHLSVSTVRGRFSEVSGTILFDPANPAKSSVTAIIKAASVNTDNSMRDKHLSSPDFFDTAKYPELKFQSTSVRKTGANQYVAIGNLTIKDVTKQVEIPFTLAQGKNMKGGPMIGVEAHFSIDRTEYHVSYDPTGMGVAKQINIELDVEANQTK